MKELYAVTAIAGALYFLLKKRRFDLLTLAYFSALIYFLPAFYGTVMSPMGPQDPVASPLVPEAYAVMWAIIVVIVLAAVCYDQTPHRTRRHVRLSGTASAGTWALLLAATGCAMSIATIGVGILLNPDKNVVLSHANRWLDLWEFGGAIAVVFLFARRRRFLFAVAVLLLVGDMLIGFRMAFAFAFLACFLLWAEEQGRQRLGVRRVHSLLVAAVLIAFLFIYKAVSFALKSGRWDVVVNSLASWSGYRVIIVNSEPFVTESVLNEVLRTQFHVPFEHFASTLYQFTFFANSVGVKMTGFNEVFQPALFPHIVDMGLGNNIWAEMWSSGGWPLLIAFMIVDVLLLVRMSTFLRIDNPELRAGLAVPAVAWAFYIHRNDLFEETNILKRLLLVGAACIVAAMLSHDATHRVLLRVRQSRRRLIPRSRHGAAAR